MRPFVVLRNQPDDEISSNLAPINNLHKGVAVTSSCIWLLALSGWPKIAGLNCLHGAQDLSWYKPATESTHFPSLF